MKTPKIFVRTVEGRIARTSPRGEMIPSDRYIQVERTAYITRLIEIHGDVIVQPAQKPTKAEPANNPKE